MTPEVDIVYLSCCEKWWDWERAGFVSRPAQIARALAEHPSVHRLLVVDTPSSVARHLVPRRGGSAARSGLSAVDATVHVLDQTRLLPRERTTPAAYRLNGRLHERGLVRSIKGAAERLGMRDPVIWLTGPVVMRTADGFPGALVVYDAMDEWLALPEMEAMRPLVDESYARIRERADVVFAVSRRLMERFSGGRPQAYLVPNAVDGTRFDAAGEMPADLAAIPGPRVGYVGMLQQRIDTGLVAKLAGLMPNTSFVFVGPVLEPEHFEPLRRFGNVHFLGPRPSAVVQDYLTHLDACFLPHLDTELTRNMDPLKLYEYIAAGRLTVASDVAFEQPPELVRRAADADEFAEHLRAAIDGTWSCDPELRESHLRRSTWPERVDRMLGYVADARDARSVRTAAGA